MPRLLHVVQHLCKQRHDLLRSLRFPTESVEVSLVLGQLPCQSIRVPSLRQSIGAGFATQSIVQVSNALLCWVLAPPSLVARFAPQTVVAAFSHHSRLLPCSPDIVTTTSRGLARSFGDGQGSRVRSLLLTGCFFQHQSLFEVISIFLLWVLCRLCSVVFDAVHDFEKRRLAGDSRLKRSKANHNLRRCTRNLQVGPNWKAKRRKWRINVRRKVRSSKSWLIWRGGLRSQ